MCKHLKALEVVLAGQMWIVHSSEHNKAHLNCNVETTGDHKPQVQDFCMRPEVLMVMKIKTVILWVVTP
jgi:hypothetical protein